MLISVYITSCNKLISETKLPVKENKKQLNYHKVKKLILLYYLLFIIIIYYYYIIFYIIIL